jgi:hypothetical protein
MNHKSSDFLVDIPEASQSHQVDAFRSGSSNPVYGLCARYACPFTTIRNIKTPDDPAM